MESKKVCLDAGHSASNRANKSPDGTYFEHEFTWNMAKRIKVHLERHGVEVTETRPDGGDVSLGQRCRISNDARPDLFVSLHSNAAGSLSTGHDGWSSARGWECYVYGLSGARYEAARSILTQVASVASVIRSTPILVRPGLYVLSHTNAPAVLIEHGFHTNREDVRLLKDPAYREALASAEARGILDFLGTPWQPVSDLDAAMDKLAEAGIIDSPSRWKELNFTENSVRLLILKMAAALK
jgi:N-acetylmuramoyl-L-alanine amidase